MKKAEREKARYRATLAAGLRNALKQSHNNGTSLRAAAIATGLRYATLHRHASDQLDDISADKLVGGRPQFLNAFNERVLYICVNALDVCEYPATRATVRWIIQVLKWRQLQGIDDTASDMPMPMPTTEQLNAINVSTRCIRTLLKRVGLSVKLARKCHRSEEKKTRASPKYLDSLYTLLDKLYTALKNPRPNRMCVYLFVTVANASIAQVSLIQLCWRRDRHCSDRSRCRVFHDT